MRWNTHDLELIGRRTQSFELLVTDAVSGAPIDDVEVWCVLALLQGGRSSRDLERLPRRLARSRHGTITVTDVRRGWNLLVVRGTRTARHPFCAFAFVEVTDAPLPRQQVALGRRGQQRLRFADAAGTPIAGANVTLALPVDPRRHGPPTVTSFQEILQQWPRSLALAVHTATTDERGEATLDAPLATQLVLWLEHPEHGVTFLHEVVVGERGGVLQVTAR